MAISDALATAAEYRTAIGKTDTGSDAQILLDLKAISRYVERRLGRFFNVDASNVTRLYTPDVVTRHLEIDDLVSVSTIKADEDQDGLFTDEDAWASTDYQLWPLNAALGPEAEPYTAIYVPDWSDQSAFARGVQVQIVGKFGWPAVPETIKRACIELTGILRLESVRATSRVNELDEVVSTSPEAQRLIGDLQRQYRRIGFG